MKSTTILYEGVRLKVEFTDNYEIIKDGGIKMGDIGFRPYDRTWLHFKKPQIGARIIHYYLVIRPIEKKNIQKTIIFYDQEITVDIPEGFTIVNDGVVEAGDKYYYRLKNEDTHSWKESSDTPRWIIGSKVSTYYLVIRPTDNQNPLMKQWIEECLAIQVKIDKVLKKDDFLSAGVLKTKKDTITKCISDYKKSLNNHD